jgi:hypothetical protein
MSHSRDLVENGTIPAKLRRSVPLYNRSYPHSLGFSFTYTKLQRSVAICLYGFDLNVQVIFFIFEKMHRNASHLNHSAVVEVQHSARPAFAPVIIYGYHSYLQKEAPRQINTIIICMFK